MQQSRLGYMPFVILVTLLWMTPPLAGDIYLSALPDMIDELSTNPGILNMTMYGFMMVMAIFTFLMGPVSDKYGRIPVLRVSLIIFIVTAVLSAMSPNVWFFIICRLQQAVGAGGAVTVGMALVKDSFEGHQRTNVLKIMSVISILAPILAPITGMLITSVSSWRMTILVPIVLGLICLGLALMLDEILTPEQRIQGGFSNTMLNVRKVTSSRQFMAFLLMSSMPYLAFMGHISVSSYIYQDIFGISPSFYTMLLAATLIIGMVAMLVITRVAARQPSHRLLPLFPVLLAISAVLMFLFGHRAWYFFFISFLFTIATSMTLRPFSTSILMASHHGDSGTVSSMINFVFFTVGCLGMVTSTLTIWSDFITAMTALIALAAVLYVIFWAVCRTGGPLKGLDNLVSGDEK